MLHAVDTLPGGGASYSTAPQSSISSLQRLGHLLDGTTTPSLSKPGDPGISGSTALASASNQNVGFEVLHSLSPRLQQRGLLHPATLQSGPGGHNLATSTFQSPLELSLLRSTFLQLGAKTFGNALVPVLHITISPQKVLAGPRLCKLGVRDITSETRRLTIGVKAISHLQHAIICCFQANNTQNKFTTKFPRGRTKKTYSQRPRETSPIEQHAPALPTPAG